MNKILVEIYVPSLMSTYEVYIPLKSRVYEILSLLEEALRELSGGSFNIDPNIMLCNRNSGIIYNINLTVEQLGLSNGSQLMLI